MVPQVVRLEQAGVCDCGVVVAAGERAGSTRQPGLVVCLSCLAGFSDGDPEPGRPGPDTGPEAGAVLELPPPVAVLIPTDWAPPPRSAPAPLVEDLPSSHEDDTPEPEDVAVGLADHTVELEDLFVELDADAVGFEDVPVTVEAAAVTVPSHRRRTLLPAGLLALRPSRGREPGTTGRSDGATRALLDAAADAGVLSLHDRRLPGRRSRLAHLAFAPGGVYVVDVVRAGHAAVEVRPVHELEPDTRELVVGGRSLASAVTTTQGRVAVVRALLDEVGLSTVPTIGVICFVDAVVRSERGSDGGSDGGAEVAPEVEGVHVVSRSGLAGLVRTAGGLDREHLETLQEYLGERLPA